MMNTNATGNLRDHATELELQVLSNLESQNATLIEMGFTQEERLAILIRRASWELEILAESKALTLIKKLGTGKKEK